MKRRIKYNEIPILQAARERGDWRAVDALLPESRMRSALFAFADVCRGVLILVLGYIALASIAAVVL